MAGQGGDCNHASFQSSRGHKLVFDKERQITLSHPHKSDKSAQCCLHLFTPTLKLSEISVSKKNNDVEEGNQRFIFITHNTHYFIDHWETISVPLCDQCFLLELAEENRPSQGTGGATNPWACPNNCKNIEGFMLKTQQMLSFSYFK